MQTCRTQFNACCILLYFYHRVQLRGLRTTVNWYFFCLCNISTTSIPSFTWDTFTFAPNCNTEQSRAVIFPVDRDVGISYCRMLLNNTMLNDDSNRTGTAQSPICECGNERETVQHFFLFRCPLHREGRICMLDLIKSICVSWKDKTHLDITEFLLLAPTSNGCGSNKDNKMIRQQYLNLLKHQCLYPD